MAQWILPPHNVLFLNAAGRFSREVRSSVTNARRQLMTDVQIRQLTENLMSTAICAKEISKITQSLADASSRHSTVADDNGRRLNKAPAVIRPLSLCTGLCGQPSALAQWFYECRGLHADNPEFGKNCSKRRYCAVGGNHREIGPTGKHTCKFVGDAPSLFQAVECSTVRVRGRPRQRRGSVFKGSVPTDIRYQQCTRGQW